MSNLFEQLAIVKEELRKLEEMMYANMLQLPWDKAPEWAQWAAMDDDGVWYWYAYEPALCEEQWHSSIGICHRFDFPACTNWKESKRKRP
jgi:hypothetical protein